MKSKVEIKDDPKPEPWTLELNRHLLSTPYQVQTKWHVITGAICCGKTTLIDLLAEQGFPTLAETSRPYIEREVASGRELDEIFASPADERAMTEQQRQAEAGLRPNEVTFLDRALPDYLWFWRLMGLDLSELLTKCFHYRYASVFILDQLPLQLDGARIDDADYTARFDHALTCDYLALGYRVVRVPVLSPDERLSFVLQTLSQLKLI